MVPLHEDIHLEEIVYCLGPESRAWELHSTPGGGVRTALVGWRLSRDPIDAIVPEGVAAIIARSLCTTGRVSFLSSTLPLAPGRPLTWHPVGCNWGLLLRRSLAGLLLGRPSFPVVSTLEPALVYQVYQMMSDDVFSWSREAQVVFVSAVNGPPPLEGRHVFESLNARRSDLSWIFSQTGV